MEIPVLQAVDLTTTPHNEVSFPIDAVTSGVAWHYTNAQGFLGIVQSHRLWASASLALNDTSEVNYGESLIKRVWRNAIKDDLLPACIEFTEHVLGFELADFAADGLFVLSASLDGDLLSQWRSYAGTDGFAIGIDMSVPLSILAEPAEDWESDGEVDVVTSPADDSALSVDPQWTRVIYDEVQQIELVIAVLRVAVGIATYKAEVLGIPYGQGTWEADTTAVRGMMLHAAALMKHPAFMDEREVRFLCSKKYAGDVENYRVGAGRLVPYVNVAANRDNDNRWSTDGSEPLPIVKARYGPSSDTRGLKVAASLLERNDYVDVEIGQSQIPIAP